MADADAAERRGRPTEALPLLVEACSLWRGDIAAGYRAMGDLTSARAVEAKAAERRAGLLED